MLSFFFMIIPKKIMRVLSPYMASFVSFFSDSIFVSYLSRLTVYFFEVFQRITHLSELNLPELHHIVYNLRQKLLMDFLSNDFHLLTQNDEEYSNNFQSTYNCFERNSVLFHSLQYLIHVKEQINKLPDQTKGIRTKCLKEIRPDDTAVSLSKKIAQKYQEVVDGKPEGEPMEDTDIFLLIYKTFKSEIFTAIFLFHIEVLFRLAFSVFILMLFQKAEQDNKQLAYLYVAILIVFWYLSQLFRQLGQNISYLLSIKIKSAFAMLLYAKLSKLTSHVLNVSEHRDKIPIMIANVMSLIEQRTATVLQITVFPAMLIGVTIIIYLRIGWPCFIGIVLIFISLPFIIKIALTKFETMKIVNKCRDKRTELTTQLIQNIKYIKMNGWELYFQKLIKKARDEEVGSFKKLAILRATERAIGNSVALTGVLLMFIVANSISTLTTPKIFSVMEARGILRAAVMLIVMGIGLYYEMKVIMGRVALVMNIEERSMIHLSELDELEQPEQPQQPEHPKNQSVENINVNLIESEHNIKIAELATDPKARRERQMKTIKTFKRQTESLLLKKGTVLFKNFNGYWKKQFVRPALRNFNFQFDSPKLYCITGRVGSGKSSLLEAIYGQIPYYSGKLIVNGSIAYVEQGAVVFSESFRSNILFGRPYNKALYQRAVKMSCLASDFENLPEKDQTFIGQKGINLSGGERIRLALARAVYSEADIYLFDHPLASVDYNVAKKIFYRCIQPLSKEKLVILVTHRTTLLKACDQLIIMKNGDIHDHGHPEQVGIRNGLWTKFVLTQHVIKDDDEEEKQFAQLIKRVSNPPQETVYQNNQNQDANNLIDAQAMLQENEKTTKVSSQTYKRFFFANSLNYVLLPVSFLVLCLSEAIIIVFLRVLADYKFVANGTSANFGGDFGRFWGTLGALALGNMIVLAVKEFMVNMTLVVSTSKVHENMIKSFLRMPPSFYEETTSGVLVNKFTTDLAVLDNSLAVIFIDAVVGPILVIVAIINVVYEAPYFAIPAGILMIIIVAFLIYSRTAFVACKQLDLNNKGPIFHFFNETLYGLTQIRIYGRRQAKIKELAHIMNRSIKAGIAFDVVSRGFGFYQGIVATLMMAAGMWLGIQLLPPNQTNRYGVAVLYLIAICDNLQFMLKQMINVQSNLVSAQRIIQFDLFERENDLRTDYDKEIGLTEEVEAEANDELVQQDWPEKAYIDMENLSIRYKNQMRKVLNGISFKINEGEKVAIVGRSGAGKSSLISALFRMMEPESGCKYNIGGYNALNMGLHSLRQHISLIHQNPFVFRGTIKENLDPSGKIPDQILWQALADMGLDTLVDQLPKKLNTQISDRSDSFSQGEKQLLCLARVSLNNNKFLVLDQATSNLDTNSDVFIQKVLRQKFRNATVIAVAHRLDTVTDYDKVFVMEKGYIVEEGQPYQLIRKKAIFYTMIQHSGATESQNIIRAIREKTKAKGLLKKSGEL